jgi:hypothetical protein
MSIQLAFISFLLSILAFYMLNEFAYPKIFVDTTMSPNSPPRNAGPLALPFYLANFGSICWNLWSVMKMDSWFESHKINSCENYKGGRSYHDN